MSARKRKQKNRARAKRQQQKAAAAQRKEDDAASAGVPIEPIAAEFITKSNNFLSDLRKEKAAQLLAEGDLTVADIAKVSGVRRETVYAWQKDPDFAARIAEISKDLADLERRFIITRKMFRLLGLQEWLLSIQRVKDARAASMSVPSEHGGDSGLLVRRYRMVGHGETAQLVEEYVFDASLAKEFREFLKHAAQEAGEWVDKVAPTTPDGNEQYNGMLAIDLDEYRKLPYPERIRLLRSPLRVAPGDRKSAGVSDGVN